jgi:hypothetical protein
MATLVISDKAKITPEYTKAWRRLTFDHGDSYIPSILVGSSLGDVETYVLSWTLPDRTNDSRFMIADPEDSNTSKTWLDYLHDFVKRRAADGADFVVVDPRSGSNMDVVLVDYRLPLRGVAKQAFDCELRVREWRDAA